MKKHCPLIFALLKPVAFNSLGYSIRDEATLCLEEKCAWFDRNHQDCAIKVISKAASFYIEDDEK